MPREILQNTPESEIKRQEAIHEIIYTEEDYVRDLNLLEEVSMDEIGEGRMCTKMRYDQ